MCTTVVVNKWTNLGKLIMADDPEVPATGAVFTFGKSKFAENAPSKFWIKKDLIVKISCGDEHTAVVTQTGRLFTFGSNEFGQLGLGHNNNVQKPSCVKCLKPDRVTAVACGKAHTVVAMASGQMWGFGSNAEGQLGVGRQPEMTNKPLEIDPAAIEEPVLDLEAGSAHTIALGQSGAVYVWGSNKEGQLGLGADGEETIYVPHKLISFNEPVAAISCGYYHCAFVTTDGALFTFGESDSGKLGLGSDADQPTRVDISEKIINVSCGGDHTVALTVDGEAYSFGASSNGQLGLGTRILETPKPVKLASLANHKILQVSCGENHTAIVTDDGHLLTFGDGRHGKLCLDVETLTNHYTPALSSRFRGFHVENAICGGCHTMVQARPIPDYHAGTDGRAEEDSSSLANGHEEINLEARRRHRQEKLPPLSANLGDSTEGILTVEPPSDMEAADRVLQDGHNEQPEEDGKQNGNDHHKEDDNKSDASGESDEEKEAKDTVAEKIEEVKETKGKKISNFFKNLGRKKSTDVQEIVIGKDTDKDVEEHQHKSPANSDKSGTVGDSGGSGQATPTEPSNKAKKHVRFFSRNKKNSAESAKSNESPKNKVPPKVEEEEKEEEEAKKDKVKDEDTNDEGASSSEDSEDDDVSSIDDASQPVKADKSHHHQKHVRIGGQEEITDTSPAPVTVNGRKKSKACTLL